MDAISDRPRRVLVVEPDAVTRELLINVFRLAGFEAIPTDTGEQALHRTRRERGAFDALLSAAKLPGLVDGWILADEFRSTQPGRPVVVATDEEALEDERSAVVSCPVAPFTALAVIKGLLDRCQGEMTGAGWTEPPRAVA